VATTKNSNAATTAENDTKSFFMAPSLVLPRKPRAAFFKELFAFWVFALRHNLSGQELFFEFRARRGFEPRSGACQKHGNELLVVSSVGQLMRRESMALCY
jgi:hypothetical protein